MSDYWVKWAGEHPIQCVLNVFTSLWILARLWRGIREAQREVFGHVVDKTRKAYEWERDKGYLIAWLEEEYKKRHSGHK
jgi:hypothetical protein